MSDDLIKRSDAVKAVFQKPAIHGSDGSWYHADDIKDALENVPSADRPQGEWICHKGGWIDFDYYPTKYECDQCHHYVDVASDKKFCPNCGADMRSKIVGKHADFMMIDEACAKGAEQMTNDEAKYLVERLKALCADLTELLDQATEELGRIEQVDTPQEGRSRK